MQKLPQPINGTEEYLKAIHQELVKLNAALAAGAVAPEPTVSAEQVAQEIGKKLARQAPKKGA